MQRNLLRTFTITLCLLLGIALASGGDKHPVSAAHPTCAPVVFVVSPLPEATVNQAYSAIIASTGGVAPYSFTLKSGALPNGIVFNNGAFSGTPTQTGTFTFTIETTDSNGCTGTQEFSLRVQAPPTIIPVNALTFVQGSNTANLTLATVNDVETAVGSLTVTANIVPAGLTLMDVINDNGAIKATLVVACDASVNTKTIALSVSDSFATVQAEVTVNVTANTVPTLGTYANTTVPVFGTTTVTPSALPADNGSVTNVSVSAPGFTGTITASAAGIVSISNAEPVGTYTVTVTVQDNCALSTQRSFTLTVNKATPIITWNNPANITYGTPLSNAQLNATANTAGNFTYSPPLNTVLNAGNGQTLTVNFIPSDTTNFTTASQNVAINVLKAPLTVTAANAWRNVNEANPPFSGTITGLVNGDVVTASYTTTALLSSPAGTYPITATLNDPNNRLSNYNVTSTNGTLTILASCNVGISPVSFTTASLGIPFAQSLTAIALTSGAAGSYTYSLVTGTLPLGLQLVNNAGIFALQGTPTTPGTFTFTLLAQKVGGGCNRARTYTMTVAPTVIPIAECITNNGNGTFTARFGYENFTGAVVTIPVGVNNYFSVGAQNRSQPTVFQPGRVTNAFTVTFQTNGSDASSWLLKGPDNVLRSALLTTTSPTCPQ